MKPTPLLVALCLFSPIALADSFRVDVLLFEDRYNPSGAAGEVLPDAVASVAGDAVALDDVNALAAAGIQLLDDTDAATGLQAVWGNLLNSKRFEPIWRLSWIQKDPPQYNAPRMLIRIGTPIDLPRQEPTYFGDFRAQPLDPGQAWPIQGELSLALGRYLHLDTKLAWTQRSTSGELKQFWLRERRRMRSGELHHIDSPRFGLMARIMPYTPPEPPTPEPLAPAQ